LHINPPVNWERLRIVNVHRSIRRQLIRTKRAGLNVFFARGCRQMMACMLASELDARVFSSRRGLEDFYDQ